MKYQYRDKKIITEKPGEEYKNMIYEFIVQNKGRAKPDEIKKKTGISLQTINIHLKDLVKEWKIVKVAYGEYRLRDRRLGEIYHFAYVLKKASRILIDSWAIDPQFDSFGNIMPQLRMEDSIDFYLRETTASKIVSEKVCKTNFANAGLYERYLFEFVNRIGAFIVYTFIESLRPIDWEPNNKSVTADRDEYTSSLIRKAIDIEQIFSDFRQLFDIVPHHHDSKYKSDKERNIEKISDLISRGWPKIYKAEKKDYERLSDLFRRVYPTMHSGLEKYWSDNVMSILTESKFVLKEYAIFDHVHKWTKEKLYKTNTEYYLCRVCAALSSDPVESKQSKTISK